MIDGASHCDFEAPTNNVCRVLCGGASDALQEQIRHATVEAAVELLSLAAATAMPACRRRAVSAGPGTRAA